MGFLKLYVLSLVLTFAALPYYSHSANILSISVSVTNQMTTPVALTNCRQENTTLVKALSLQPKASWSFVDKVNVDAEGGRAECDLNAGGAKKGHFVVFDFHRDLIKCSTSELACAWAVRPDGLYLFYFSIWNLVYRW